ncbi:Phosphatidylglycerol/phosphatidylinositol transfer protein [Irineochytrium annulatum]|nr:Phosphatidylglycerol/phosphatidylinositol transfer protein [Irineochytrium annulatum]
MLKLAVATFLVLATAVMGQSLSGFTNCGSTSDSLTLTSLSYSPSPVVPGEPLHITVGGNLTTAVTAGASIHVTATVFGFVSVLNEDEDLCSAQGVSCPIQPGDDETLSFSFNIPSNAPSGMTVAIKAVVTNTDGSEVTCVQNRNFVI